MGCFDFLPRFNRCCICIPLQAGCFIIGVWYLILGPMYAGLGYHVNDTDDCQYLSILKYVYMPMGIIMTIAAVFFLLGMCGIFRGSWTAELLMWSAFLHSLGGLILSIVMCILTLASKCDKGNGLNRCSWIPLAFIIFLLTLHLIGCINVYKSEM